MKSRFNLLRNYLSGIYRFSTMPIELIIEISNRCNLNCIMCPRQEIKSPLQDMKFSLFKKIIDEAAGHVELIDFAFRGESLLNENIFEMISYAKSKKIKTFLPTNATQLDLEKSVRLLKSGLDLLTINIDALVPETYDKIRKNANLNQVIKNLEVFLEQKSKIKNNTFVILQIIPLAENYLEVNNFLKYWRKVPGVDAVRIKPFSSRAGLVNNPLYINRFPKQKTMWSGRCVRLWRSLAIYSDGSVVPCCYDFAEKYTLGNLNLQTIKEIWSGKKMLELRKKHIYRDFAQLEPCNKCEVLEMNILKQSLTFVFESLLVHKLLVFCNFFYKMNFPKHDFK